MASFLVTASEAREPQSRTLVQRAPITLNRCQPFGRVFDGVNRSLECVETLTWLSRLCGRWWSGLSDDWAGVMGGWDYFVRQLEPDRRITLEEAALPLGDHTSRGPVEVVRPPRGLIGASPSKVSLVE